MSRLVAFAAFVLCCAHAVADPAAAERLGVLLQDIRRIEADFHQVLRDEQGEVLQESGGRLALKHPGRFRWETLEPFPQLVVSDGTRVWQYDPDLSQVVIRPLDRRADQIPSLLLGGEVEEVSRHYSISMSRDDAGAERFELLPLEPGGVFASLALQFRNQVLERLEISDGLGQRTEVSFARVRAVAELADSLFAFETPPGVDELHDE